MKRIAVFGVLMIGSFLVGCQPLAQPTTPTIYPTPAAATQPTSTTPAPTAQQVADAVAKDIQVYGPGVQAVTSAVPSPYTAIASVAIGAIISAAGSYLAVRQHQQTVAQGTTSVLQTTLGAADEVAALSKTKKT